MENVYKIYGHSNAVGWIKVNEVYDYESAKLEAESLDPIKYCQYIIIGYNLKTNEPILTETRFIDYNKLKTLRKKYNNENTKTNR